MCRLRFHLLEHLIVTFLIRKLIKWLRCFWLILGVFNGYFFLAIVLVLHALYYSLIPIGDITVVSELI